MSEAVAWINGRLQRRIGSIGQQVITLFVAVGQVSQLFAQVMYVLIYNRPRRAVMVRQLYQVGYLSLPIVILTGICIGLVMAVQTYSTLGQFNGENVTGAMVNFSMATQLMPC